MIKTYIRKILGDLKNTAHLSPDANLFADETSLFNQINELKPFPKEIEHKYQSHLNYDFVKSGYSIIVLLIGILVATIFTDLLIFNQSLIPFITKIALIVSCFVYLFFLLEKKQQEKLIHTSISLIILALLQTFISSLALPNPLNHYYGLGFFIVMMAAVILYRLSLKNIYIISFSVILLQLTLEVIYFYKNPNASFINHLNFYILGTTLAMTVFGVLSSNLAVKSHRRGWLRAQLLNIEKDKQTKLLKLMKKRALTDGLTKLYNRRFFDKKLDAYWQKHVDFNKPLSIIMIDVDWFKKYNDNYGHQKGDQCLIQIAKILAAEVKHFNQAYTDKINPLSTLLARYGGEEFIIVMPNTFLEQATEFGKSVCNKVMSYRIEHNFSPLKFCTISVGVATINRPSIGDQTIAQAKLIKQADDALYLAKKQGKNQVCNASETSSISLESMKVV